jgi:hypothetical protein
MVDDSLSLLNNIHIYQCSIDYSRLDSDLCQFLHLLLLPEKHFFRPLTPLTCGKVEVDKVSCFWMAWLRPFEQEEVFMLLIVSQVINQKIETHAFIERSGFIYSVWPVRSRILHHFVRKWLLNDHHPNISMIGTQSNLSPRLEAEPMIRMLEPKQSLPSLKVTSRFSD